jgi:4-amino-4-deoxy-L-arabinose transferase-like glycosyltransferase
VAAVLALLLVAAAQRAWNIWTLPALSGFDAPGHAAYVWTILREGRLPHPYEGWSTFHPPLYYLIAAAVWRILEPLGPHGVAVGLKAIGAVATLAAGLVTFLISLRLGAGSGTAWVAMALVLFLPSAQISAAWIGNESLAAGLAALALLPLLALQRDPRDVRKAIATGVLAASALATKYTGVFIVSAAFVPFLRRDFDRRMLRALAFLILTGSLIAGPVYLRNMRLAGTPFPMTREREPMRSVERYFVLRDRRVCDYLTFDPACVLRPSIFHAPYQWPNLNTRNRDMTNVWGLLYASTWYDAFASRVPLEFHRDGVWTEPLLGLGGVVPTLVMLGGLLAAAVGALRSHGRSADAPLVVMFVVGIAAFVAFTWRAPSMAAAKGSYLLPLVAPAGVFFARGARALERRVRFVVLLVSALAALCAAIVFTNDVVFRSGPMIQMEIDSWHSYAGTLHSPPIDRALDYFLKSP